MKELIEKLLRFDAPFAFLMPGFLLTISLLLWLKVDPLDPRWNLFLTNEFLLLFLLLAVSYVFSIILQRFFVRIPRKYSQEWWYRNAGETPHIPVSKTDMLAAQRFLCAASKEKGNDYLIEAADGSHLRFLALYGSSLALLGVGIQALVRLVVLVLDRPAWLSTLNQALPRISVTSLVVIIVITMVAYVQLRRMAVREWILELYFTDQLKRAAD